MSEESLSNLSQLNIAAAERAKETLANTQEAGDALKLAQVEAAQAVSQQKLLDEAEDNSAMGIQIRTQKLEKKKEVKTEKAKQVQESILVRKEDADGLADEFSQRQGNREYRLDPRILSQLAEDLGIGIHENLNTDDIISFIRRRMTINGQSPDVSIVDKAFEFLLEVARSQLGKSTGVAKERFENIYKKIEIAKNKHFETNSVEIQVAQKIIGAVDAVATATGQSIKETLDRYRDIVHNPPDIQSLRKFYQIKGYKAMLLELKGLSTYLGGNFKRTNLETPEMLQLASAARKMQTLLNVFRLTKEHARRTENYLFEYIFTHKYAPIDSPHYQPKYYFISNIQLGTTTTITTTMNHDYEIGQPCKLIIPSSNGSHQLNDQAGLVIAIPTANQLVLSIDSSKNVNRFVTSSAKIQPQIEAIDETEFHARMRNKKHAA
jgi:hypothetical protein